MLTGWQNSGDTGITGHPVPKNRNEVASGPGPIPVVSGQDPPQAWELQSGPSLSAEGLAPVLLGGQDSGY